jgi:hypothetical protein
VTACQHLRGGGCDEKGRGDLCLSIIVITGGTQAVLYCFSYYFYIVSSSYIQSQRVSILPASS